MKHIHKQDGQILLIVVMLFALALTIVMSISFKSITESQITKLEEESQKALAAAEAGIEAALKTSDTGVKSFTDLGILSELQPGIQTGSVTIESVQDTEFVTPVLMNDETYTFYLVDYNTETGILSGTSYGGNLNIYYGQNSSDCSQIALELTFISGNSPYTVTRYLADLGDKVSTVASSGRVGNTRGSAKTMEGISFWCEILVITKPSDAKLLLARPINKDTRIGFEGGIPLKLQGKTITSEAQSTGGVKKKVLFFQSYPQIHTGFYTTIFNSIN